MALVEVVYASPAEGGAQTALATVAAQLGKRATIFVAQRAQLHPRTLMAQRLGAKIEQVPYGYRTSVRNTHASIAKNTVRTWHRSALMCGVPYKLLLMRRALSEYSPMKSGVLPVRAS